jgi:diadenosine tetraphosphate (Ap4A) HIT family hydrolase
MNDTLIHRRVAAARDGTNPAVITRMPAGWAVVGDHQVVHGYSLLLPDPVVPDLNALSRMARSAFLRDMAMLGDALLEVTGADRINYEILGNSEAALHAHLFPRYRTEPQAFRSGPVWLYDWSTAPTFERAAYAEFIASLDKALTERARANRRAFLERLRTWVEPRDDVRALVVVGSVARGDDRPDSDVDVVLLTTDPGRYLERTGWVAEFGPSETVEIEDYGRVTSVRACYADGLEVEFAIAPDDWASPPVDPGTHGVVRRGIAVLLDRDEYATALAAAAGGPAPR